MRRIFSSSAIRFVFGVQAAGGVDDHVVDLARLRGLQRVEHDGARVGPLLLADDVDAGARAPDFELLDGGGAEGVGGAEQHRAAFGLDIAGEFADGGGLPRPVHADDHHDGRRLVDALHRTLVGLQDFEQALLIRLRSSWRIADQLAVHALADPVENFRRRC